MCPIAVYDLSSQRVLHVHWHAHLDCTCVLCIVKHVWLVLYVHIEINFDLSENPPMCLQTGVPPVCLARPTDQWY